jgi:hypothetical protein
MKRETRRIADDKIENLAKSDFLNLALQRI